MLLLDRRDWFSLTRIGVNRTQTRAKTDRLGSVRTNKQGRAEQSAVGQNKVGQSRAEQSRAEQSRVEQSGFDLSGTEGLANRTDSSREVRKCVYQKSRRERVTKSVTRSAVSYVPFLH